MLVRQAWSAAFKVQVNFVGHWIEYRRPCDPANILNKGDSKWHFRKLIVPVG